MTWILILTLFSPDTRSGASIASVSGFQTKTACITAGSLWLDQIPTGGDMWGFVKRVTCVPNK